MADHGYKISVVIPVYNCEEFLNDCVESLKKQTMPQNDFQIVFVNDGSTDNSGKICSALALENDNITYFEKENGGVSSARNKGIELSEGKYILYLDADDTLTDDTLEAVYRFFEEHYDETDLVTYKIVPYRDGKPCAVHYRYRILKETGIYDLNDLSFCHIAQSTMNICVKNLGKNNALFDTSMTIHEDQKYCFTVLRKKLTIGYVSGPEYHYLRRPGSAMGKMKAYYIFEKAMEMWESLFGSYPDSVPRYLQAFFLHDINWKGTSDVLLPYHYSDEEFSNAVSRLKALIDRVDDAVILSRPSMDTYHKHYLLKLKGSDNISYSLENGEISLLFGGEPVYTSQYVTAAVTHLRVKNCILSIDAFLKSPVFIYCGKPKVWLIKDGVKTELEAEHSQQEYYHANIKNSVFWRIRTDINISDAKSFRFEVEIEGKSFMVNCYHLAFSPFVQKKKHRAILRSGLWIKEKKGVFRIIKDRSPAGKLSALGTMIYNLFFFLNLNPRVLYNRLLALSAKRSKKRIWIYLDRYGVFDNAYYQFKHDFGKNDGIARYYIINDCDLDAVDEHFTAEEKKYLAVFHSKQHKMLYFSCEKLITGFSNLSNVSPFSGAAMKWYSDLTDYEMVYLQHGILHASLLKMYGREFCVCDKVVISSGFEKKNFTENYGYAEKDLIAACMPRYDKMEIAGEKKNRILFSPSWRSNLIGNLVNNERAELPEAFTSSAFFEQVSEFLNSEKLHELLEKNDLYLDFQNHPIFKCYNHLFNITNDRVCMDPGETKQDEYRLMITDYSSIVFDSVYLNCPIIYFVPDYDLFLAGVSHNYRKLDLPLEEGFGPFAHDARELLSFLEDYIGNGFVPREPYASRMKDFFLYRDNNCCDRLYDAMLAD